MKANAGRHFTRREFVHTTAAAATAALVLPGGLMASGTRRADVIRVGVIGCGGRGSGAIRDHCRANTDVEIVAIGDLFPDRLEQALRNLNQVAQRDEDFASKFRVTEDSVFTGFDAYQRVLEQDIDLVILATPPGFRPLHIAAAVEAGKHIFTEKPVAVDAAGVRSVLASYELALQKGLAIVAGTQRRHDLSYRAVIERIHDGAIGEITGGQVYWNQAGLWHNAPRPEWSDTEWQIRNWLYFTWLSGDHIVEQHVHNIDVANWVMGTHPIRAVGMGGRQSRTAPEFGHIYDHFAVDFEYPNGVHIMSMARQVDGTAGFVGERFFGTNGRTNAETRIERLDGTLVYEYDGDDPNAYVQEHADLVASIRAGQPINELRQVAESTLTAIMGREAAYTGAEVTWDQMLAADQDLMPPEIRFGPLEVPPVAVPGTTKLERRWLEGWA
ncbi:MAG TPA: Gfo/Idh/MocA family oxidoreductase [Longimicrobiales bacterium]|nr:Gfo/Idh/MocA family oxidoreductase [Longimicrobiales bacterium]